MRNSRNVPNYLFGAGAISQLSQLVEDRKTSRQDFAVYFVDHYFENHLEKLQLKKSDQDLIFFVDTTTEPKTHVIDRLTTETRNHQGNPVAVVGLGGGSTLDTAKAVSNLLGNPGSAEKYQGWDLLEKPGVFKVGVPTLSGTGAESSRTCVLMNIEKNLKLGMNSEHSIFDQLVLDPDLTETVGRNQYFYTGMDTYIHCVESLQGSARHMVADAYSHQALTLCREVFGSENMQSPENRGKLMVASYFGGVAIANSYVGVVHPFSAGLSVTLGVHHCIGNCIVMNVMEEFYPEETREFHSMVKRQNIHIPRRLCQGLTDEQYDVLYKSTVVHEKPLTNALGPEFKDVLTKNKVIDIFTRM